MELTDKIVAEYLGWTMEELADAKNMIEDNRSTSTGLSKLVKKMEVARVFDCWNECGVIQHKSLSQKMSNVIQAKLNQGYSADDLCTAIRNYAYIVSNPKKFWFQYKWTLADFLQRGLEKFTSMEVALQNYSHKDLKKREEKEIKEYRID